MPSRRTLPQEPIRVRDSARWARKKYQSIASEARRLPTRIAHQTSAPSIDLLSAPTTPKTNTSKLANRITKARNRAGSRSLTAMRLAAMTPNAMNARPWTIV